MSNPTKTFGPGLNSAGIQSADGDLDQNLATSVLQGLVECAVAIRTRDLVADLLDFSTAEEKEPCDVRALIEQSIENHRAAAAKKQIVFQTGISAGLWANADRSALLHVLDNLISNAVKCSPANSTIQIHALPEKNNVVINIRDQGVSTNEAGQQRLFQKIARFMTVPAGVKFSDGTGRAEVKKYSRALPGSIKWRSSLGSGSTFTLELPISSGPSVPAELPEIQMLAHTFWKLPESTRASFTRN